MINDAVNNLDRYLDIPTKNIKYVLLKDDSNISQPAPIEELEIEPYPPML